MVPTISSLVTSRCGGASFRVLVRVLIGFILDILLLLILADVIHYTEHPVLIF